MPMAGDRKNQKERGRPLSLTAMTQSVSSRSAARRGRQTQRVNLDFPIDLLHAIDREARRVGVSRQAFIKLKLADTLARAR
jgi:hypothetical protein